MLCREAVKYDRSCQFGPVGMKRQVRTRLLFSPLSLNSAEIPNVFSGSNDVQVPTAVYSFLALAIHDSKKDRINFLRMTKKNISVCFQMRFNCHILPINQHYKVAKRERNNLSFIMDRQITDREIGKDRQMDSQIVRQTDGRTDGPLTE